MLSGRRASACMALVGVLLLAVMPSTARAVVAAEDTSTVSSYVDYFLGDLFDIPGSGANMETKKAPRFRPWGVFHVPDDGVLAFDCAGDVPTLRVLPRDPTLMGVDDSGDLPPDTCGSGAGTPTRYKFNRPGKDNTGFSALFWGRHGGEDEAAAPPLMPVPKFQLKAILKALAAVMESLWRDERGEPAMPESVPFTADTVGFYVKSSGLLVVMGREDVEFHNPWERLQGKIKPLTMGPIV